MDPREPVREPEQPAPIGDPPREEVTESNPSDLEGAAHGQ